MDRKKRSIHPNSLQNLRPGWIPGQSGNPKGRNGNCLSITERWKKMMNQVCRFDPQGRTWGDVWAESGGTQAMKRPEALKNVQDRLEGKVAEPIQITGEGGQPIAVSITYRVVNGNIKS